MFFSGATFIGIDPTAGQKPYSYAAINDDLHLLALGEAVMEEVLAFVAGQQHASVAVCAPRRPNQGLMEQIEVRESLSPLPRPGRWTNFRLAEYLLRQRNIRIPQTPSQEQDCPNWMQSGFNLFRRLEKLGFQEYARSNIDRQSLEVYPHAAYTVLLGLAPFYKNSLEGRIQRQLILHELRINLPDPMLFFEEITRYRLLNGILPDDELYSPGELDALVASYTACLAVTQPEAITCLGDPVEGQIILPVPDLRAHY